MQPSIQPVEGIMKKSGTGPPLREAPSRGRNRSGESHAAFFTLMITFLCLSTDPLAAQYTGPELGSIPGGATVTTGEMAGLADGITPDRSGVKGRYREKLGPPLADDFLNNTPPAGPLGSNVFIDPAAGPGSRLISDPPGVMIDFEGIPDRGTSIPPDPDRGKRAH